MGSLAALALRLSGFAETSRFEGGRRGSGVTFKGHVNTAHCAVLRTARINSENRGRNAQSDANNMLASETMRDTNETRVVSRNYRAAGAGGIEFRRRPERREPKHTSLIRNAT